MYMSHSTSNNAGQKMLLFAKENEKVKNKDWLVLNHKQLLSVRCHWYLLCVRSNI